MMMTSSDVMCTSEKQESRSVWLMSMSERIYNSPLSSPSEPSRMARLNDAMVFSGKEADACGRIRALEDGQPDWSFSRQGSIPLGVPSTLALVVPDRPAWVTLSMAASSREKRVVDVRGREERRERGKDICQSMAALALARFHSTWRCEGQFLHPPALASALANCGTAPTAPVQAPTRPVLSSLALWHTDRLTHINKGRLHGVHVC
jgi:hypothetical protein